MRIALLGASGLVGSRILEEALSRGHPVTAIVRHPERLPQKPGLQARKIDIFRTQELIDGIRGHDALISAYNPGHDLAANPHLYREVVEGTLSIIRGVKAAGVPHLTYIGGAGSLLARPNLRVADDPDFPAKYSVHVPPALQVFAAQKTVSIDIPLAGRTACLLFEHDRSFDWSFISPPLFMEPGIRSGRYTLGDDRFPWDGDRPAGISIEDLAVAVLDEVEKPRHIHQHFTVMR
jgi:uncharacterized protein